MLMPSLLHALIAVNNTICLWRLNNSGSAVFTSDLNETINGYGRRFASRPLSVLFNADSVFCEHTTISVYFNFLFSNNLPFEIALVAVPSLGFVQMFIPTGLAIFGGDDYGRGKTFIL